MENVICNLCGNAQSDTYETVSDLLLERHDVQVELVQCVECSLVYQNPRPTPAEIGEHYPPEYVSYVDHASEKKRSWLLQQAIEYGFRKRQRFITRHKKGGSLLDIGCAAGTFILGMRDLKNWQVAGVELSEDVAAMARERYDLNVFSGTLENAAFEDEQFDVVTMWDVLEHVHDPIATLNEIHRILKPDGLLLTRVPNLACWDVALFGNCWAGYDAPRHLYIFTPQTLKETLAKAGFHAFENSSGSASYMTFVLSVKFWLTAKGVSEQTKSLLIGLLYHPIARLISAPFFYLPNFALRGPILVTLSKKE